MIREGCRLSYQLLFCLIECITHTLPVFHPHLISKREECVLAVGVKYWNKQGGKCLCEEQDKERLFSFFGILGSE